MNWTRLLFEPTMGPPAERTQFLLGRSMRSLMRGASYLRLEGPPWQRRVVSAEQVSRV